MFKIKLKEEHGFAAAGTFDGIISKRKKYVISPCYHVEIYAFLIFGNNMVKAFISSAVSGIDTIITYHFKVLFRNMSEKSFNEFHDRNFFNDQLFIFMTIVMEGNAVTVVMFNTFGGNDRSAEITANIFDNIGGIAAIVPGKDVKTVNVIFVDIRLDRFKRGTNLRFHCIKQGCTKGISEISVIEMCYPAPYRKISGGAFRKKTVNMRIPLQITPESMKNTDKTGSKIFGLVHFEKQAGYDTVNSREKTV